MANKFNVDYWIEGWVLGGGRAQFKIHLDDKWCPASYDDCVVVIVRNDKWWVGVKVHRAKPSCALRHVKIFANKHLSKDHEIAEYFSYGDQEDE